MEPTNRWSFGARFCSLKLYVDRWENKTQLNNGDPLKDLGALSPWLDLRAPPKEISWAELDAQKSRRFIKTHLPADALVMSPKAKYLYVARDGRDVVMSLFNHHSSANDLW